MPKETFFNLNEEKQHKVMRSAINEFLKNGFEKGNIGDIAKNAGVAKGSMYQYFASKKELFLFSVQWSTELLLKKSKIDLSVKNIDIFDYLYHTSKQMWSQLMEEREIVIFIENVFLGKYSSLNDESMAYMMKMHHEYVLQLIQNGKKNGHVRQDIDDNILCLFITGASLKIKEYMMNKARSAGEDLVDESFEAYEQEIKALIELIKNGMGAH